MTRRSFLSIAVAAILAAAFSSPSLGSVQGTVLKTYTFDAVTSNGAASVAIAEAQAFVDVMDTGITGEVLFLFRNTGPDASSITQIYFEEFSDPLANPPEFRLFTAFQGLIDADDGAGGLAGVDFSQDIPNNPNGNNTPNLPSATNASPPL